MSPRKAPEPRPAARPKESCYRLTVVAFHMGLPMRWQPIVSAATQEEAMAKGEVLYGAGAVTTRAERTHESSLHRKEGVNARAIQRYRKRLAELEGPKP